MYHKMSKKDIYALIDGYNVMIGSYNELVKRDAPTNDGEDVYIEDQDHNVHYIGHASDFEKWNARYTLGPCIPPRSYLGIGNQHNNKYTIHVCSG